MELSTQQVADTLSVAYNTVINYTERSDDPLPVLEIRQRGLHKERAFAPADVEAWANRHGLTFRQPERE